VLVQLSSLVIGLTTRVTDMILRYWFVEVLSIHVVFQVYVCTCFVVTVFKCAFLLIVIFLLFSRARGVMVGVLVGGTEGPPTYRTNIFIHPSNLGLTLLLVVEIFLVSVVDHNPTELASMVFYLFIPVVLWVLLMDHFHMSH